MELHNHHNHCTLSSHALSKRDVSESTKRTLLGLFSEGHGPGEALHIMKFDMQQLLSASEYVAQSADRSVIPGIHYASR